MQIEFVFITVSNLEIGPALREVLVPSNLNYSVIFVLNLKDFLSSFDQSQTPPLIIALAWTKQFDKLKKRLPIPFMYLQISSPFQKLCGHSYLGDCRCIQ